MIVYDISLQDYADPEEEATKVDYPQPIILIQGTLRKPNNATLALEKQALGNVKFSDLPVILLATYYVFNMKYCPGSTNLFTFFEALFLNHATPKRVRIAHILGMLS